MKDVGETLLAIGATVGLVVASAYVAARILDSRGVPVPRAEPPRLPALASAAQWQQEVDRRMRVIEAESHEMRTTVMQLVESLAQLLPAAHTSTASAPAYRVTQQQRATA